MGYFFVIRKPFALSTDDYGRGQSSSVSPRGGGYGSSASTPHSTNGTNGSTYINPPPTSGGGGGGGGGGGSGGGGGGNGGNPSNSGPNNGNGGNSGYNGSTMPNTTSAASSVQLTNMNSPTATSHPSLFNSSSSKHYDDDTVLVHAVYLYSYLPTIISL